MRVAWWWLQRTRAWLALLDVLNRNPCEMSYHSFVGPVRGIMWQIPGPTCRHHPRCVVNRGSFLARRRERREWLRVARDVRDHSDRRAAP